MMRAMIIALCLLAMPAHAKPIAAARTAYGAIVLDDQRGACPEGTKSGTWIGRAGNVGACWFVAHGRVWLIYDDGDAGHITLGALRWESS